MARKSHPFRLAAGIVAVLALIGAGASLRGPSTKPADVVPTTAPTKMPKVRLDVAAVDAYAQKAGFSPSVSDDKGYSRCDYTLKSSRKAELTWTDGTHAHTVTGDPDDLTRLYFEILPLCAWQTCTYSVKAHSLVGYNAKANTKCATLEDYTAQLRDTLTTTAAAPAIPEDINVQITEPPSVKPDPIPTRNPYAPKATVRADVKSSTYTYILNTRSKKFHYSSCKDAGNMSAKNRMKYTGTRDDVIAMGYKPCKNCDP